jgi:hypothetical protein
VDIRAVPLSLAPVTQELHDVHCMDNMSKKLLTATAKKVNMDMVSMVRTAWRTA